MTAFGRGAITVGTADIGRIAAAPLLGSNWPLAARLLSAYSRRKQSLVSDRYRMAEIERLGATSPPGTRLTGNAETKSKQALPTSRGVTGKNLNLGKLIGVWRRIVVIVYDH